MERCSRDRPDWKDAACYRPLLGADRSVLAWEWLRRDPAYAAAAEARAGAPEQWGLHAFEPADVAAPAARPIWSAAVCPFVLTADAKESLCSADDLVDLERLGAAACIAESGHGREHLLISDGLRSIRVDLASGTLRRGPTRLGYQLSGFASAERPLLTLRRLLAFCRTGRFARALHPAEARAGRWVLMLRAWDGLLGGADQREIAAVLLSRDAAEPRWRSRAPSLRSQAQRLTRGARTMARGGYLDLLR